MNTDKNTKLFGNKTKTTIIKKTPKNTKREAKNRRRSNMQPKERQEVSDDVMKSYNKKECANSSQSCHIFLRFLIKKTKNLLHKKVKSKNKVESTQ